MPSRASVTATAGVKALNALIATVSTPTAAPVIAATRLRKGSVNSARGAARLVADALVTARGAGAAGLVVLRADSAFYAHDVIAAARRGARFSVTARQTLAVVAAISGIDEAAWTAIRYPNAVWDQDEGRWISDAEVAETAFTAFTGRRRREQVTARLIVRRVRRLNPASAPAGQGELFAAYRYHASCFTEPAADARGRGRPPRARDRRAGHRRSEGQCLGPLPRAGSRPMAPGWYAPRWRST
jgi:hypothetical protein